MGGRWFWGDFSIPGGEMCENGEKCQSYKSSWVGDLCWADDVSSPLLAPPISGVCKNAYISVWGFPRVQIMYMIEPHHAL